MSTRGLVLTATAAAAAEAGLIHLGRTYGSTKEERRARLPGDDIIAEARVQTDHAVTIDAPPSAVWPWVAQMGWGRAGWYTADWVDRLLFPANGPSLDHIVAELQDIDVGTFIPDGPPETECGLHVVSIEPGRSLVLRSNSHLPMSWRERATLDWTWTFVLTPQDGGRRCRYHFRSRWVTSPWWFTAAGWLGIVPADFVMSRDHLHGIKERAERPAQAGRSVPSRGRTPGWTATSRPSCPLRERAGAGRQPRSLA